MTGMKLIDELIEQTDDRCHSDFCRLLVAMMWNV
jgi:hypothetical protein